MVSHSPAGFTTRYGLVVAFGSPLGQYSCPQIQETSGDGSTDLGPLETMIATTQVTAPAWTPRYFRLSYGPGGSAEILLADGWNYISSPVDSPQNIADLLGSAARAEPAFVYRWRPTSSSLCGFRRTTAWLPSPAMVYTIPVERLQYTSAGRGPVGKELVRQPGWNLIGPAEEVALPSNRSWTSPPFAGTLGSNAYHAVPAGTLLIPGQAYWLHLSGEVPRADRPLPLSKLVPPAGWHQVPSGGRHLPVSRFARAQVRSVNSKDEPNEKRAQGETEPHRSQQCVGAGPGPRPPLTGSSLQRRHVGS